MCASLYNTYVHVESHISDLNLNLALSLLICIIVIIYFIMFSLWKKSYDQPRQHIKKQRLYFANKGQSSQSYGFPVFMYGRESWTVKKAECQRIEAFDLWCWRRLLRVPWTAGRYNQLILKEISCEYSLEGLVLKLKLQYFGHLM